VSDAINQLADALERAGARVIFDSGNNATHHCTYCGTRPVVAHKTMSIGTYPNGDPIRRPVCAQCEPVVEARRVAGERPLPALPEGICKDCRRPVCAEGVPFDEDTHCPRSWSSAKASIESDLHTQRDCYWSGLEKAKAERRRMIALLRRLTDVLGDAAASLLTGEESDLV
jgi:hypothetical protein